MMPFPGGSDYGWEERERKENVSLNLVVGWTLGDQADRNIAGMYLERAFLLADCIYIFH